MQDFHFTGGACEMGQKLLLLLYPTPLKITKPKMLKNSMLFKDFTYKCLKTQRFLMFFHQISPGGQPTNQQHFSRFRRVAKFMNKNKIRKDFKKHLMVEKVTFQKVVFLRKDSPGFSCVFFDPSLAFLRFWPVFREKIPPGGMMPRKSKKTRISHGFLTPFI